MKFNMLQVLFVVNTICAVMVGIEYSWAAGVFVWLSLFYSLCMMAD